MICQAKITSKSAPKMSKQFFFPKMKKNFHIMFNKEKNQILNRQFSKSHLDTLKYRN